MCYLENKGSLSNAFDLISGSKFREDIYPNILEIKMGHPILLIHACAYRTVIYSVVIVSRNLEGPMKMTDLKCKLSILISKLECRITPPLL